MNDFPVPRLNAQATSMFRSIGMKLIVVCFLALFMAIPALFVNGLIEERTSRASDVVKEISGYVGGQQTFLGPTLAIPYTIDPASEHPRPGTYFVFPSHGSAQVTTTTEERRRSLFKVPVFQANLKFDADFDLAGVPSAAPPGAVLDWNRAEFVLGVSDARGALADAVLTAAGKTATLVPSAIGPDFRFGSDANDGIKLTLFGTPADGSAKPGSQFHVNAQLRFSGAQRVAILAYGKSTNLSIKGDWPSPGFDGGFLPVNRTIAASGFSADWSVPFLARGVRAEGNCDAISGLAKTALGVSFIEVADPYQSVSRSLKYVLLFLGLLFLSYFVFEVTTGKRVHPAQYILVGISQIIFYLLLLSLAERIGFDRGFLIAGAATVSLLSANAIWVFASRLQGLRALVVFSTLYALIYLLLRLQDNALLVGAIASFLAVSAVMYFTRGIDWYGTPNSTREADPHGSNLR